MFPSSLYVVSRDSVAIVTALTASRREQQQAQRFTLAVSREEIRQPRRFPPSFLGGVASNSINLAGIERERSVDEDEDVVKIRA